MRAPLRGAQWTCRAPRPGDRSAAARCRRRRGPPARRNSRLPGVAITAEACSTPGSFPSDAESCISDTESRYRFGSRRWMYTDLYTRVSFRRAARRRPARPSYTQNTLCLGPAAAFAARSVHPGAHRAPRQGPDLDRARAARRARGARRRARAAQRRRAAALRHSLRDQGQHRLPGASHHRRLPANSPTGPKRAPRWSSGSSPRARSRSARPISTSSPPAWSACARPTACRRTASIPPTSPAARARARRSRSRPGS